MTFFEMGTEIDRPVDGTSWTPLPTTAGTGGAATAKLSGLAGGTWHIRGTSAQTDTASAAAAKEATLLVEGYKAAGAKYLAIVAKPNKAISKLNNLLDADASLASLKKQAALLSAGVTQEAKDFRAYKGWPRAVAPVIEELAKASVVDADHFHLMSQVAASTSGTSSWPMRTRTAKARPLPRPRPARSAQAKPPPIAGVAPACSLCRRGSKRPVALKPARGEMMRPSKAYSFRSYASMSGPPSPSVRRNPAAS